MSPSSGNVSAKLVPDPSSKQVELGPGEEYVKPELYRSNPRPEYPRDLIPLHLAPHVVGLRVTFDERGNAIEIVQSPVVESTASDYAPRFEAVAREALQAWRCHPAQIRKFRDGPDSDGDGKADYRILAASRRLKAFFDLSFSFEVVNGQPVVRSL